MPLDREPLDGRHFSPYDGGEGDRPGGAKVDLVHAHPGVALGTVGHDTIVAGEGDHGRGGEAVAIDGSDSRDCKVERSDFP